MATNISPITFLKEVRQELAKVIWPTRAETIRMTLIVIAVSVAIGLFIGTLDIIFVKIMSLVV